MHHFKWSKAHAVFLPEVDAEHRNLFRMAEELQQALRTGAEVARVLDLVRPLAVAIEEHFAHEERIMRAASCPDAAWHKGQHDTARKRLADAVADLEAGGRDEVDEFVDFLGKWFRDHMSLSDRMMAAHVRNHDRLVAIAS
jgi:hemerythrin